MAIARSISMLTKSTRAVSSALLMSLCAYAVVGCGNTGGAAATEAITPTHTTPGVTESTFTPSVIPVGQVAQEATPLPTAVATEVPMMNLRIWWPEPLSPLEQSEANEVLNSFLADFATSEETEVNIDFRLKQPSDTGGIMLTLRTASVVAPGALPDVTLMRRQDMLTAADEGLIYPLEGLVLSGVLGDLYDSALELGRVDDRIYGLPYMVDVLHLAYNPAALPEDITTADWSFEAILDRNQAWAFPAGRVNSVNNMLYAQYLDAGGVPPTDGIASNISRAALLEVFTFYQAATEAELFDLEILDYETTDAYLTMLTAGEVSVATLSSTRYLQLRNEGESLLPAPIPTASGEPTGTLNGWMWVITTSNAEQQVLASRFINWMMSTNRQRRFSEAVNMLPSQRAAMQSTNDPFVDAVLMDALLQNAVPPLTSVTASTLTRAMQTAVGTLLSGAATAEQATQSVLDQMGS